MSQKKHNTKTELGWRKAVFSLKISIFVSELMTKFFFSTKFDTGIAICRSWSGIEKFDGILSDKRMLSEDFPLMEDANSEWM